MKRRTFLKQTAAAAATLSLSKGAADQPRTFKLWACGDCHVGTDIKHGRKSLAESLHQSEFGGDEGGPPFDWDIAVHVGDYAGAQGSPDDDEGREVVDQFSVLKKHRREQIYDLAGNHDASGPGEETQWWFKKWIDPTGESTESSGVDPAKRPYPIDGTWERYSFRAGNLLFLLMSDRNDGGPPVGRATKGGYPAGAVTPETFEWWKKQIEANPGAIVLSAHHHMLKETTVASGPWEGFRKKPNGDWLSHYHGYFPAGGPEGASYLYWLGDRPDAQSFENYLAAHPGATDLWFGGHTHTNPDDDYGGRTHIETKWDTHFINCAALSRYHASKTTLPMSRLLTFTEGSPEVRVQCYLHTSQHAPQGWYPKAERTLKLRRPFQI